MAKTVTLKGGKVLTGKAAKNYGNTKGSQPFKVGGKNYTADSLDEARKMAASESAEGSARDSGVPLRNEQQTNPYGYYGTKDNRFPNTSINPNAPTVFSNASIIEDTIPRLVSQANSLPTFGSSDNAGGGGGGDYEDSFDDILGFSDKKKKKKQDFGDLAYREGTNIPLPVGYWETQYGDNSQVMKTLAKMQQTSDRYTKDSIGGIRDKFDQREQAQVESNAQNLAGVKQVLNLGGSSRYAPISSQGIISAQESAGIKALADIDTLERQAINEARQAQSTNDFKLLEQKLSVLDGIRQEKAAAMTSLQEAQEQSDKDNQIADLVSQGIVDPVEMLQTLNERGGNFTLADMTGALKGLSEVGTGGGSFKFEQKQVGPLLGMGFTVSDINQMQSDFNSGQSIQSVLEGVPAEMQQAVKEALGVDEAAAATMRPGVGATDNLSEQMIRTRLFPKAAAILNKGTLSDSDRTIIDERIDFFRNNGLSEQQILDVFSGWSADVTSPYNDSFRDIIIGNDKDGQGVSPNLSRVGSLLANGNYKGAMNAVEQTAMLRAKELDPDGYMGNAPVEVYTKRIDRIKQLLSQNSDYGDTGFIEGNFNKVLGRLKGARAAQVKAELTQLYQTFRKENAGVAVTDSEQRFLDSLFSDINDPKGNFLTKLDVFQSGIIDRYNATRNSVSLPPVRVLEVLDPAERLSLYGKLDARSTDSNDAGI